MAILSLSGNDSVASVRRPAIEINFGSGSQEDWQKTLAFLSIECGMAPFVDVAEIHLSTDPRAPSVEMEDSGGISLGYEDSDTETVFSGQVEYLRSGLNGKTIISAANGGASLSRLRINQSYEQQNAGDIVNDLAGTAGAGSGTIESGIDYPFYAIDDRRNAYRHIAEFASHNGFLAYVDPENKLQFVSFSEGNAVQSFVFGTDILSLQVLEATPVNGKTIAVGEGAAGSEGQDAWNWLVKDPSPVTHQAGGGEPERRFSIVALRSSEAVQTTAESLASAASRVNITGRILVPGAPVVTVGSIIEIKDAPQDALNGKGLVRQVKHRYSKWEGFTTQIIFSKIEGGAFGGLGGLL